MRRMLAPKLMAALPWLMDRFRMNDFIGFMVRERVTLQTKKRVLINGAITLKMAGPPGFLAALRAPRPSG